MMIIVCSMMSNSIVEVVPLDYVSGCYLDAIFEIFDQHQLDVDAMVQGAF